MPQSLLGPTAPRLEIRLDDEAEIEVTERLGERGDP